MVITALLALPFTSRVTVDDRTVIDRVFPLIRLEHPPGQGTFYPGSFAANFFLPSAILMVLMTWIAPSVFSSLLRGRANVFLYITGVIVAILEVAGDTLLPLVHLPGAWGFRIAVTLLHGGFVFAIVFAAAASRGSDREW
jgi:hypothetical protein